jgi:hypothetical protein
MRPFRLRIADLGLRIVEGDPPSVLSNGNGSAVVTWFVVGLIGAVVVGWISAKIHASGHAPVGLTSFGIGALLGVMASVLAAKSSVEGTRALLLGTLLFAAVAILSEHAWLYHDFRGQWQEARASNAAVAMFREETPPSPRAYFAHEWRPVLWITDAALIVATSLCVVVFKRSAVSGKSASRPTPNPRNLDP